MTETNKGHESFYGVPPLSKMWAWIISCLATNSEHSFCLMRNHYVSLDPLWKRVIVNIVWGVRGSNHQSTACFLWSLESERFNLLVYTDYFALDVKMGSYFFPFFFITKRNQRILTIFSYSWHFLEGVRRKWHLSSKRDTPKRIKPL